MKPLRTLKTFECRIENYFSGSFARQHGVTDLVSNHIAPTRSAARYKFYAEHGEDFLGKFGDAQRHIKVRSKGPIKPEHFFCDAEDFKSVCKKRNIEFAYQGMVIDVAGKKGWIVGVNNSCNLEVLFVGDTHRSNCHPTYETTYYENAFINKPGKIVMDFKNKVKNN